MEPQGHLGQKLARHFPDGWPLAKLPSYPLDGPDYRAILGHLGQKLARHFKDGWDRAPDRRLGFFRFFTFFGIFWRHVFDYFLVTFWAVFGAHVEAHFEIRSAQEKWKMSPKRP